MYFPANLNKNQDKTQGPFENPRKNPRPSEKNPRIQDCIEKPKILGENPSSGNAGVEQIRIFIMKLHSTINDLTTTGNNHNDPECDVDISSEASDLKVCKAVLYVSN